MLGPSRIMLTRDSNDYGTKLRWYSSVNDPLNKHLSWNINFLTILTAFTKCIASQTCSHCCNHGHGVTANLTFGDLYKHICAYFCSWTAYIAFNQNYLNGIQNLALGNMLVLESSSYLNVVYRYNWLKLNYLTQYKIVIRHNRDAAKLHRICTTLGRFVL